MNELQSKKLIQASFLAVIMAIMLVIILPSTVREPLSTVALLTYVSLMGFVVHLIRWLRDPN